MFLLGKKIFSSNFYLMKLSIVKGKTTKEKLGKNVPPLSTEIRSLEQSNRS